MALNNTPNVVPTANVPPPTGLLHPYPPAGLANFLPNHHHQFGYCTFYSPYSHFANPWAMAALNPFLQHSSLAPPQQQTTSQLPSTANHNDPSRLIDPGACQNLLFFVNNSFYF